MGDADTLRVDEDWEFLLSFLPSGWEDKARELGALRRCRKIPNAEVLLRLLLIHLAEGCSLRETAVRAREVGLISVSDVAIMDRLRMSGPWFRWMNEELSARWLPGISPREYGDRRVRVVDGTHVTEPGPTGTSWRLHYAIDLPSLRCSEVHLSDSAGRGTGETFCHFSVHPGDLFLGDGAYGVGKGIVHVVDGGGDVLVRFGRQHLVFTTSAGSRFDLLAHLRTLSGTRLGDWPVFLDSGGHRIPGRICAAKRSRQVRDAAVIRARRKAVKHGSSIRPETLEAAGYVFVFTTLPKEVCGPSRALEFYRNRWQIEIVFKRMKSILGLGHLRKHDDEASKAWLQGKLFIALLIEVLLRCGESFFPWGYPLVRQATS